MLQDDLVPDAIPPADPAAQAWNPESLIGSRAALELASFVAVLCYAVEVAPSSYAGGAPWLSAQSILVASIFYSGPNQGVVR